MYLDKSEREHYEGQQKFRLDESSRLKEALEKADINAKVELEKAVQNTEVEFIKKSILKGLDNETIAEITGFTIKQIQKIRTQK